jgi:hypothetical protein
VGVSVLLVWKGVLVGSRYFAMVVFGRAVPFRVLDSVGVEALPVCEAGDGGDAGGVVVA